ncbi:MAG TPA: lysophospholipid acyltransferase family protein [Candidatus Acidoferrales bacterium]|nr:lysophospholipid acyltransferase family protein [Candidatus Acidoferrales bacterium]
MLVVRFIRTFAAAIFLILYGVLLGPFFILQAMLSGSVRILYPFSIGGSQIGLRIAGVQPVAEGVENIPKGVCLFVSNHVSNVDPPLVVGRIPGRVALLAKRELFRIPFLGTAMRLGRFIPVQRDVPSAARASVRLARKYMKEGVSYVIFAEGTRSRDGRLGEFKRGSFLLALESGAPVVPVTVIGTQHLLPRGAQLIRPGVGRVVFHPAVDVTQFSAATRKQLSDQVRAAIASALPPDQQPL